MFERVPSAFPARLPVAVIRLGPSLEEAAEPPGQAIDARRRDGARWIAIDGTQPQSALPVAAAPPMLWLCRRGRMTLALDDGTIQLEAGQYCVTDDGMRLDAATAPGRDCGWIALVLPARLGARLYERFHGGPAVAPLAFCEHGDLSALASDAELDRLERSMSLPADASAIADLGCALLARLVESQRTHAPRIARTSGRTIEHRRHLYARLLRVRILVAHGVARDYSMRQLARIASLSVWHFVRIFGRVFGETPHRFLTRARLEHAARLLVETETPIGAIAERLGFENRCAFARLYHGHYGVPASVYRRDARRVAQASRSAGVQHAPHAAHA